MVLEGSEVDESLLLASNPLLCSSVHIMGGRDMKHLNPFIDYCQSPNGIGETDFGLYLLYITPIEIESYRTLLSIVYKTNVLSISGIQYILLYFQLPHASYPDLWFNSIFESLDSAKLPQYRRR